MNYENDRNYDWDQIQINILQGIVIEPNEESDINRFHIYACNTFTEYNRYDSIEVKFENEISLVQVHGIVNVRSKRNEEILLKKIPMNSHYIKYDVYQYQF